MNARKIGILVLVVTLLIVGVAHAVFGLGAVPTVSVGDQQASGANSYQLQKFGLENRTCDGETYTEVSDDPVSNGRQITINATFSTTDVSQDLEANLIKASENSYHLNITTQTVDTSTKDCIGVLEYQTVLTIPQTETYTIRITHDGETAYTISSSEEQAGVGGHSSGSTGKNTTTA